jgi:hypothetical protein
MKVLDQCENCRGFLKDCPIAFFIFNDEEYRKKVYAYFFDRDDNCIMFKNMKPFLEASEDEKNQLEMFKDENGL